MAHPHSPASEKPAQSSAMPRQAPLRSASITPDAPNLTATDPLSDVLRMVKLTGALFFLVDATSPWSVEIPRAEVFGPIILPRAQHVISYHIVLQGSGYASVPGMQPTQFTAGDIIVFPHGDPYAMLSLPGQASEAVTEEALQFFRDLAQGRLPFVVTEGGGGSDHAGFVCGFLGCDTHPFNPLLAALPRLLQVRRPADVPNDLLDRLIDLTLAEARIERAGGGCIRLGLSELIFVEVIRRYLAGLASDQTGWIAGLRDPAVGRVLILLHERPDHDWTLSELSKNSGMSRSVLVDRFTHFVGLPPIHYLTQWRMQMASRLLLDSTMTVAAVGHAVGYASEAAFSRTFKRIAGVSPAAWRNRRPAPDPPLARSEKIMGGVLS